MTQSININKYYAIKVSWISGIVICVILLAMAYVSEGLVGVGTAKAFLFLAGIILSSTVVSLFVYYQLACSYMVISDSFAEICWMSDIRIYSVNESDPLVISLDKAGRFWLFSQTETKTMKVRKGAFPDLRRQLQSHKGIVWGPEAGT